MNGFGRADSYGLVGAACITNTSGVATPVGGEEGIVEGFA